MSNVQFHSDLDRLIEILPPKITKYVNADKLFDVIELVLDLGRQAEIRHSDGSIEYIGDENVTEEDIKYITDRVQEFTSDNRSGIPGTLHRISAIRNRQGKIVGLTCRIGRVVTGTIACIKDFVVQNKSILFLGRPGVGKTTKLREISRLVADDLHKRVVVVDTSNEIAGDGDTPHPAIGHARRMQVTQPEFQKDVMIEAVENHTPEVIVVDEIGTEAEAQAARTIAERGVMLIATAHGNTLENLIKNPVLSDLVGGIQSVTLGDDEAKRRACQKTVLEREKQPTFDIVIEIIDRNTLAVLVDKVNKLDEKVNQASDSLKFSFSRQQYVKQAKGYKKIYIYAVSRSIVDKAIERLNLDAELTKNIDDADIIIAHKNFAKGGNKILSIANEYRLPIYYVRSNSTSQVQKVLKEALNIEDDNICVFHDETEEALDEAKEAIKKVLQDGEDVELSPQNTQIRKMQHELVEQHNLSSESVGEGSERHLKIVGGKEFKKNIG